MLKEMHGTIDLLSLMTPKDSSNFLEEKSLSLNNCQSSSGEACFGPPIGYRILITGQEMSMTCLQFGCLVLLIDLISLTNTAE